MNTCVDFLSIPTLPSEAVRAPMSPLLIDGLSLRRLSALSTGADAARRAWQKFTENGTPLSRRLRPRLRLIQKPGGAVIYEMQMTAGLPDGLEATSALMMTAVPQIRSELLRQRDVQNTYDQLDESLVDGARVDLMNRVWDVHFAVATRLSETTVSLKIQTPHPAVILRLLDLSRSLSLDAPAANPRR